MIDDYSTFEDPQTFHIERSTSAPPIAEHLSQASRLPISNDFNLDSLMTNNSNPSRLNPRIPIPVRQQFGDPNDSFNPDHLFNEGSDVGTILDSTLLNNNSNRGGGLLKSFLDPKSHNSMDLMQNDFPMTSANVFGNMNKSEEEHSQTSSLISPSKPKKIDSSIDSAGGVDMSQLYISEDGGYNNVSSLTMNQLKPLENVNIQTNLNPSIPPYASAHNRQRGGPGVGLPNGKLFVAVEPNIPVQQGYNMPIHQQIPVQYIPVDVNGLGLPFNGGNLVMPNYYIPQSQAPGTTQMYVDPNLYYRVGGATNGMFPQQELVYTQEVTNSDGSVSYIPHYTTGGYWQPAHPQHANVAPLGNNGSNRSRPMYNQSPQAPPQPILLAQPLNSQNVGAQQSAQVGQQQGQYLNPHGIHVNQVPLSITVPTQPISPRSQTIVQNGINSTQKNKSPPPQPQYQNVSAPMQGYAAALNGTLTTNSGQNSPRSNDNRNVDMSYDDTSKESLSNNNSPRRDRSKLSSNSSASSNSTVSLRDSVVEEFRNTYGKSRQWDIRDLIGHVVAFCQDQHGSRFIQQRLEVSQDNEKQIVFEEVLPAAQSLMTDVFGNYVIQKLFEYGSPHQCDTLALVLTGQAVPLALQMYGCRVIQKALEYVSKDRLIALVQEFEGPSVLRCVHDQNGNHVIQKCIEVICKMAKDCSQQEADSLHSKIQFIIDAFKGRVKELSMHPYGCRVVQRILEHCSNSQKSVVLDELRQCCDELIQDQYGNYVIQHVMQHGWDADKAKLVKNVQSRLLEYSQHKFASNVVEKCILYAERKDRDEMIWKIINVTFDLNCPVDAKTGQCVLESMVRDPYANYVVQKVIDVSDQSQRGAIMRYVRENIVQLRRYTYGKHIIVRLEKVSGEKF